MWPWVEISSGIHQVCIRMGTAEPIAISTKTTAKSLPMRRLLAEKTNLDTVSVGLPETGRARVARPGLIGFCDKRKINGLSFAPGNRNFLGLRAIALMPRRQRVLPRRKIRQLEISGSVGNGIMRSTEHREVAMHPGMNVALHGNE